MESFKCIRSEHLPFVSKRFPVEFLPVAEIESGEFIHACPFGYLPEGLFCAHGDQGVPFCSASFWKCSQYSPTGHEKGTLPPGKVTRSVSRLSSKTRLDFFRIMAGTSLLQFLHFVESPRRRSVFLSSGLDAGKHNPRALPVLSHGF